MVQQEISERSVIPALIAGVAIYGLAMGTTYPLLGVILSDQVSVTLNGLNAAATGLGLLLGVAAVPTVSRWLGAGWTAIVGIVAMTTALGVLALQPQIWVLFAGRMLLGFGANLLFVVVETALNVFAPADRRGRLMGIYVAAVAVGFVVGPSVVSAMPDAPVAILIGCLVVTALSILPLSIVRKPVNRSVQPTRSLRALKVLVGFPLAFGFLFVASAVDAVIIGLLPVIALDQAFTVETGALFVAVFHVGLLLGQPLVGFMLDRIGRRQTVLWCCVWSLFCATAMVAAAKLGFWFAAILFFVWGGTNFGLYTAGLALIGDRFRGASLTAATAAFAGTYAVASATAPAITGALVDGIGAVGFYLAVAGVYLIVLVIAAASFRPLEPTLSRGCSGSASSRSL